MPNNVNLQITNNPSYIFYIDKNRVADLEGKFVGKWMYFFNNSHVAFAESICKKAVQSGAVIEAKHTSQESIDFLGLPTGVYCFYVRADDKDAQREALQFLIENDLIRRTKAGKLFDISFKFDEQTRAREYGLSFDGKIRLSDYVDLQTGEFIS